MTQAIRDAGFTPVPEDVRLTIRGSLEKRDDRFVLVPEGMTSPLELACVEGAGPDGTRVRLGERAGQRVEARGRWIFEGDARIEIESISPLDASP